MRVCMVVKMVDAGIGRQEYRDAETLALIVINCGSRSRKGNVRGAFKNGGATIQRDAVNDMRCPYNM